MAGPRRKHPRRNGAACPFPPLLFFTITVVELSITSVSLLAGKYITVTSNAQLVAPMQHRSERNNKSSFVIILRLLATALLYTGGSFKLNKVPSSPSAAHTRTQLYNSKLYDDTLKLRWWHRQKLHETSLSCCIKWR